MISMSLEMFDGGMLKKTLRERCIDALDYLEEKKPAVGYSWGKNWLPAHGGDTSQLEGLKLCSRKDSSPKVKEPYHVGLAEGSFRNIKKPAVEAAFAKEDPSIEEVVAALRKALKGLL